MGTEPGLWAPHADPSPGEVFVNGKTRELAQALLAAAREAGVSIQTVRAVNGGFIVPENVYDQYETDRGTDAGI